MAAVVPARRCEQSRRERARPRAHQSDNRCYTGFYNANPTTESGPALNSVPVPISLPMAEKWKAEKWGGGKMAAVVPLRWRKQLRRERARRRAHQPDDRCYTGLANASPASECLPVGGGRNGRVPGARLKNNTWFLSLCLRAKCHDWVRESKGTGVFGEAPRWTGNACCARTFTGLPRLEWGSSRSIRPGWQRIDRKIRRSAGQQKRRDPARHCNSRRCRLGTTLRRISKA